MTYQVPPIVDSVPCDSIQESDASLDEAAWYFYRYASVEPEQRPSLLATTNREKSKLNAVLQDIATMIYTRSGPLVSATDFLQQYTRLKLWREELPSKIGNIEPNRHVLPHVVYLL